jgi:hypothetical protein
VPAAERKVAGAERRAEDVNTIESLELAHNQVVEEMLQKRMEAVG